MLIKRRWKSATHDTLALVYSENTNLYVHVLHYYQNGEKVRVFQFVPIFYIYGFLEFCRYVFFNEIHYGDTLMIIS